VATPEEIKHGTNQTKKAPGGRGGARPGAGRKPKLMVQEVPQSAVKVHLEPQARGGALKRSKSAPVEISERDMLDLLQDIALGRVDATHIQVRAAIAAVQYTHAKQGEGGKKEKSQKDAEKVASRFASAPPPRLAAAGGKKV
jgi:hypothetical protein